MSAAHPLPGAAGPGESLIERLTAQRRLLFALTFVLCVVVGAQVRAVGQRDGAFYPGSDIPVGADFNAFYSAGRIVADGDGARLYDLDRQQAAQAKSLGRDADEYDGLQPFVYPAFVAAPYALLARLPFVEAYLLTTMVMLAAAIATVALLRPVSPTVRDRPLLVTLALLASQPLSATIFGGQTVAISLLCLAGGYSALRRERDLAAGVWLGLLLYKPPLAVPLLALLLWRRRRRVVATAAAVGGALALIGIAVAGPAWPWRFLDLARGAFYVGDAEENGHNMISLLGVAEQLFGVKSAWAQGIAGALSLGAVALLIHAWRGVRPEGRDFPLQFGLAIVVTLLISPHALFYEASLLFFPVIALIDGWRADAVSLTSTRRLGLIGLFGVGFTWQLGALIGVQPLAALPVVVGVVTWRALHRAGREVPIVTDRLVSRDQDFVGGITYVPPRESAHDGRFSGL